jgi:phosphoglycolate phosphatase-like HAD superfamily hydrolase
MKQVILVDIDGTILNFLKRKAKVLQDLGVAVPFEEVGRYHSSEIISKYVNPEEEHKLELYRRIMLCLDERGLEYLKLDEPQPFAAEVLSCWAVDHQITYITGRLESTRKATIEQFKKFSFPFDDSIFMAKMSEAFDPPERVKRRILKEIKDIKPSFVIDDLPRLFEVYKSAGIKERVGFCTGFYGYTPKLYLQHGATKVIKSWKELKSYGLQAKVHRLRSGVFSPGDTL